MPKFTNSFKGGMNKDVSPDEYPNTCYFDAQNFRVIVDEGSGLTTASLASPKGNVVSFTLPTSTYYLGSTTLRDDLIILAKNTTGGLAKPDKIYKISLSDIIGGSGILIDDTYLMYEEDLGFDLDYPIHVVANYENSSVQKIYWVDGLNPLKHLNIINSNTNNLSTLDPELLNILPNHTYGSYTLTEQEGGHLKAGRIQYSYQLYSISGTETLFAPPSNLYNLTSYTIADAIDFVGDEIETDVNKSIKVDITLETDIQYIFNRIRLIALEYEMYGDVPTVRVVAELELGNNTISFVDSGNTIAKLTLEEFQLIRNEITPATIDIKNNYLFAANISQEQFDVDDLVKEIADDDTAFLDTRAYRWRYVEAGISTGSGSFMLTENTDPYAVGDARGTGYGSNCFNITSVTTAPNYWELHIEIDPQAYATAHLPAGSTVTGISYIGPPYNAVLWLEKFGAWTYNLVMDMSPGHVTIVSWDGAHELVISGDSWIYSPNDLYLDTTYMHPGDFSNVDALVNFSYTFTYTYPFPAGSNYYECTVNKGLGNDTVIDPDPGTGMPNFANALESNDCINTYNNIDNDSDIDHAYKFKYNGGDPPTIADLGGTGKYVSYYFNYVDLSSAIQNTYTGTLDNNHSLVISTGVPGDASPQQVLTYTGYQRDEVYRFAVVFYDLKGRPSFAKWIGDIRFPKTNEYLSFGNNDATYELCASTAPATMVARKLYIHFNIDIAAMESDYPGLREQLSGLQIVRCPRDEDDCTIKAQGIVVPTYVPTTPAGEIENTNYSSYNITSAGDYDAGGPSQLIQTGGGLTVVGVEADIDPTLVELLSPEVAINKSVDSNTATDVLEVFGYLDQITTGAIFDNTFTPIPLLEVYHKSYSVTATSIVSYDYDPAQIETDWRRDLSGLLVSLPEPKSPPAHVIGLTSYTARGYDNTLDGDKPEMTFKGTSLVMEIDSAFTSVDDGGAANNSKAMYGRYRKKLGYSIYGGATYSERSYSKYIKAGEFNTISSITIASHNNVFNGDVYIGPFNFLKLFYDYDSEYCGTTDGSYSGQMLVAFPVESRINIYYKLDNIPKYYTIPDTPDYYLEEKQSIGISQFPTTYPEIGDLYRYNSAYSAQNISKIFVPKPFDYKSITTNDVMVTSSEKKFNGEYSDSWLIFKYNNYIELEGEYGSITRILNHNDRLFAFQPRGISVLSVLERELVETNNTGSLAVGTGGILSRYDYLSRKNGTSLYEAIVSTDPGLYFYDDKNIGIFRILEVLEPLSDTKGLKSYYESNKIQTLVASYDKANREVLFSPDYDISYDKNTLCFSGYTDAFTGFYTWGSGTNYVKHYIPFDRYLLSSLDGRIFYLHNAGNYNEFFGELLTSSLTLITNPSKTNVVSFHVVEWLTDLTIAGVDDLTHTFDTLQITNTHQDTGVMTLATREDLIRRFRAWRLNTFRDSGDEGRIRDSWIKSHFIWTQDSNYKKLVVHPIDYLYLPTKIR